MPGIRLEFSDNSNYYLNQIFSLINQSQNLIDIKNLKPHLTLLRIYKNFNKNDVIIIKEIIKDISTQFNNFKINIEGIGFFKKKNNKYEIFLIPVYSSEMQNIHKYLWKQLNSKNIQLLDEEYYSPEHFSPHISIPMTNNNKTNLLKIMNQFTNINCKFEIKSKQLSFIDSNTLFYNKKLKF